MNKQRKFILIAAGLGIIGMFLPWIRVSFLGYTAGSVNGMHDWGILGFLGFLAAGAVTLMGDQTKALDKTMWMVALVGSGLALLTAVIFFIRASDAISYISFGFYIALIGAIGAAYFAYTYRAAGYNIKDGFNSLKEDIEKKTKNDNPTPPSSTL